MGGMWTCLRSFAVKAATPDVVPKQDEYPGAGIDRISIKSGGSDDDFKSNSSAMYRGVFAMLTLVRSMPY
jgi:hypothetical protein